MYYLFPSPSQHSTEHASSTQRFPEKPLRQIALVWNVIDTYFEIKIVLFQRLCAFSYMLLSHHSCVFKGTNENTCIVWYRILRLHSFWLKFYRKEEKFKHRKLISGIYCKAVMSSFFSWSQPASSQSPVPPPSPAPGSESFTWTGTSARKWTTCVLHPSQDRGCVMYCSKVSSEDWTILVQYWISEGHPGS